jgi:RNA polymerase sigma factor (sigma-70 family)
MPSDAAAPNSPIFPDLPLPAFDELVGCYYSLAYNRARALLGDADLAHDAVQEAFTVAFQNIESLRRPAAFPAWLLRLVSTQCGRMRRRKSPHFSPPADLERCPDAAPDPEHLAIEADLRTKIAARIAALPTHERDVTRLYYLEGYSQDEVAAAVGIPTQTVKSRLYSSRQRLHRSLGGLLSAGQVWGGGLAPKDLALKSLALKSITQKDLAFGNTMPRPRRRMRHRVWA